jgi:sugar phosphate isomerase/epimerase
VSGDTAPARPDPAPDTGKVLEGCFVNLPLRYIAEDPEYLDLFLRLGLQPELGIDAWTLDHKTQALHDHVSSTLSAAGLSCGVHLPFFDLQPGSQDRLVLEATRNRLTQALRCARTYSPAHLVAHIGFDQLVYGRSPREWQERSIDTWKVVLSAWPDHPPLYLENVHERDAPWVGEYLSRMSGLRVGLCFDVGHWHSFGMGASLGTLHSWLDLLGCVPFHLHLHDNAGLADEHLGLGRGSIPLSEILERINRMGSRAGATFEPHTREDLHCTVEFVRANAHLFAFRGASSAKKEGGACGKEH